MSYLLIVEDSQAETHLLKEAFSMHAFPGEVEIIRTGRSFLSFMDLEKSSVPKLLVMDLRLPDIDGIEILKEIKANPVFQDTPVIIRTGSHDPRDKEVCESLGILDFMIKKVGFESVEEQALKIKTYWNSL